MAKPEEKPKPKAVSLVDLACGHVFRKKDWMDKLPCDLRELVQEYIDMRRSGETMPVSDSAVHRAFCVECESRGIKPPCVEAFRRKVQIECEKP